MLTSLNFTINLAVDGPREPTPAEAAVYGENLTYAIEQMIQTIGLTPNDMSEAGFGVDSFTVDGAAA